MFLQIVNTETTFYMQQRKRRKCEIYRKSSCRHRTTFSINRIVICKNIVKKYNNCSTKNKN